MKTAMKHNNYKLVFAELSALSVRSEGFHIESPDELLAIWKVSPKHKVLMPPAVTKLTLSSGRTRADLIACIASLIDAFACLTFLFLQVNPANVGRLYIASLIDPITCIIGYWVIYRRLRGTKPILADFGISILVLGTFFST